MLYSILNVQLTGIIMVASKQYKLDLFKQLLPALDKRKFDFYKNLSDEEKKGFSDIVALRAMSAVVSNNVDDHEYAIESINMANKHMWNPALKDHPELKYLSMAVAGLGKVVRHEFIKAPSGKKRNMKILDVLSVYYPTASLNELEMFFDMNSADDIIELGNLMGLQVDEMKDFKKEVKKAKK